METRKKVPDWPAGAVDAQVAEEEDKPAAAFFDFT